MKNLVPYSEVESLRGYYFEDSYVLGIFISPDELVFHLEVVLTESNAEYRPPSIGMQYCYRSAHLKFSGISDVEKLDIKLSVGIDAQEEKDMGNIDGIETILDSGYFHVYGLWGEARFHARNASVCLQKT